MKTATLDKYFWVEILEIDNAKGFALVIDEEGYECYVPLSRLDNIEG